MITFHVDDWWNITVLPVPFFFKESSRYVVYISGILVQVILWFDQSTVNMHSSAFSSRDLLYPFKGQRERERTHALLLNPPEFSMGGATQKWPLRNHISEMFFEIRPIKYDRNVKQVCLSRRRDWPHVLILAVVQSSCVLKNYWNLQWCNLNDAIYFKSNQLLNL